MRKISPRGKTAPAYEETFVSSHTFYPRWNFTPGWLHFRLKTKAKFHPGTNSVWFQRVTAINFQPGLILCAVLWLSRKYFHTHCFLCLNNYWYNVRIASFGKNFNLKEAKTEKKSIFSMKKWDTSELRQPSSQLIP